MDFVEDILRQMAKAGDAVLLRELRAAGAVDATGSALLEQITKARAFLAGKNLKKGDRCVLLSANCTAWVAADLAIMAQGLIIVPLYARQAVTELVAMMKDCAPSLIICGDTQLKDAVELAWPEAPETILLNAIFSQAPAGETAFATGLFETDPVAIIYTSGTSGEAKGVVLDAANVKFMLGRTSQRLDRLMGKRTTRQDRVLHYLPFCFAGSWILLLTSLGRRSQLAINTDLLSIAADVKSVQPDYFLNVPQLLDRMRKAVTEQVEKKGGVVLQLFSRAEKAFQRRQAGRAKAADKFWLKAGSMIVFSSVRRKVVGKNLKALICGSAPLAIETQDYFQMLGIPVLQVYGLTETTAICTMDIPGDAMHGYVGPAIEGIEMKLTAEKEIVVRGPNIFSGYWNRAEQTANAMRDGWFHTGDQGDQDATGRWRIVGRVKNLLILGSGHNIAPEPIENEIQRKLPEAQQVVLLGHGRSYLTALVTGNTDPDSVQNALDEVNATQPHYKQVRAFQVVPEAFSVENGLLTANGKLKRDLIADRHRDRIESMYAARVAS